MSRRSSTKPDSRLGATVKPVAGPVLQRKCACGNQAGGGGECAECQKKNHELQRKVAEPESAGAHHEAIPPIVNQVLDSSGQPLDASTRSFMEPRFDHDFSGVRVHTDTRAAESAEAVNAHAYTVGNDVVFAPGQYQPGTESGNAVLAHELSHVVQQDGVSGHAAKTMSHPSDSSEREADNIAGHVLRSEPVSVNQSPGSAIQALSVEEGIGLGLSGVIAGGIIGVGIAALAGAFDKEDFTKTELDAYLQSLKDNKKKEGNRDSDNKARDVVRKKLFKGLDLDTRILLIDEMLTGSAGNDDEDAILVIITAATPKERQTIAERIGYDRLYDKFHGDQLDALYALYPEFNSLHPRGGEKRKTRSIQDYLDRWEIETGNMMTPEEKATLGRGCVGITALRMEDLKNPDLSNCYNSFAEVWSASKTMTAFLEANFPDKKAYIFSKRFWSHGLEFPTDPASGKVDVSAHSGDPRPPMGAHGFTNFDYGLYDETTGNWWHANHCDPILSTSLECKEQYSPRDRMEVYESNLQSYSTRLRDFDTQIFCVAVGRK